MPAFAGAFMLVACALPVENPPAYDAELNLCAADQADAWRSRVERCRDAYERDKSCGGVMSFAGRLEGEQITVDSELHATEFSDQINADGSELRVDVKLYGRSPYFAFSFEWRGVGGDLAGETIERRLRFDSALESLDDEVVRGALRMTVGGASKAFAPRAGTLTVVRQTLGEEIATFRADFGSAGDSLKGCFHAFPVKREIDRKQDSNAAL
jgi:hypothetical protein